MVRAFFSLYLSVAFGCLVYTVSSSLALALSKGACATMCPCFHHFLLFSAKKKWDCTSGGFYSLSYFVIHDDFLLGLGRARRNTAVCTEGWAQWAGSRQPTRRVHGSLCLRVAELYYLSGSPAAIQLGEGRRRLVGKLRSLRNVCCYWEVTNFEPKETELNSAEAEGLILSSPKIHRLRCLTWDPIDIRIVAELWCFM